MHDAFQATLISRLNRMPVDQRQDVADPGSASVPASLVAFLEHLIDYAGLFPPAGLPMEEAITAYRRYQSTPENWMLGRFICPANRLGELSGFATEEDDSRPLHLALIATASSGREAMIRAVAQDMADAQRFVTEQWPGARLDVVELKVPESVAENGFDAVQSLVARVLSEMEETDVRPERAHFEIAFTGDWRQTVGEGIRAIGKAPAGDIRAGYKIRCGGLTPHAFPTPEQVAFAIAACRSAGIPFKATAGLHHPMRHFDKSLQVVQHGFLNVFGAALFARTHELSEQALRQLVRAEQIKSFSFDDDGFAFQDLRISTDNVRSGRQSFALSFGSCSFDEPRRDLRVAGLL